MSPGPLYIETIPTPNPNEVSMRVKLDANQLKPAQLPVMGQAYSTCLFTPLSRVDEFGAWVYTYMIKEGSNIWLYFARPKTVAERNTPFRVYYSTRYYPWSPVLYALKLVRSWKVPNAIWNGSITEDAPRYFARYRLKPTPQVSSTIRVSQYLSEVPYPLGTLTHTQPIATDINADILGLRINIRCLHPKVTFTELVPGAVEVANNGTQTGGIGDVSTLLFPATNFLDWAEFTLEDQVQQEGGQFLREKVDIIPPEEPDIILQ